MLWRHPDVLKLWALYILFVTRDLGLAPATIGAVFSVANVAGLAGEIVAGGLGLIPAVLPTRATAVPLLVLSGLLGSFSGPVYNINQVSLRQAITPDRLQGRMNATMRFLVWGTMPLGGLVGGALGELFGLRPALAVSAAGTTVAFLWVLASPVRALRAIPKIA